jgi:hypothetical protein
VDNASTRVTDPMGAAVRRRMLEQANRAYAALRADPEAWAEELEERRAWEATLADDIEGDHEPRC